MYVKQSISRVSEFLHAAAECKQKSEKKNRET